MRNKHTVKRRIAQKERKWSAWWGGGGGENKRNEVMRKYRKKIFRKNKYFAVPVLIV
jgi:hypothetical protein